jgi:hypothetical protein
MFALLFNHSPVFVTGELFLGLCLGMFGFAWVGAVREKYSITIPAAEVKDPTVP